MDSLGLILAEAGVQETFIDKLREDGWTKDLFAMSAPTLEKFDDEIKDIMGDMYEITTAVRCSALRLAWTRCQSSMPSTPAALASSAAAPVESTPSQSSWSETYPPKLTSQVVAGLKQKKLI